MGAYTMKNKNNIIDKIILIGWIIIGLFTLFIQKEDPNQIEYACIWLCFLVTKIENMELKNEN